MDGFGPLGYTGTIIMDTSAFTNTTPGRLAKQGRGQASYLAFVPAPLPPVLDLDLPLILSLDEASRAVGELSGLARALPNPYLFVRPMIRREAVASSRIEGTEADLNDLYAFEAGQQVLPGMAARSETDIREVLNYVRALDHGLRRLGEFPLSLRLIREMHELLMSGVRGEHGTPGEFRHTQNWIGSPGCTLNEATYVPPPVAEMTQCLSDLESYLHASHDHPPLIRLALIHYQLEAIHPFIDGNGRIGRLLVSLLAVHWGLVPQPLLHVSSYFERRRSEYYDHLLAVSQRGAWREWVLLFLDAVRQQASDTNAKVRRLQDLQAKWQEAVRQAKASASVVMLVDHLFEAPLLTVRRAQEVLQLRTHRGAKLNVDKLVDQGILHLRGQEGGEGLYVAEAILEILMRETPEDHDTESPV